MKISAIIPAAGTGSRYSTTKHKLLEELGGIPVILRTLEAISSVKEITEVVVCTSSPEISNLLQGYKTIPGGKTRQESVFNGLKALTNPDLVLIHDGARPLISPKIIRNSISIAAKKGAAIVAVPAKDTIKRVNPGTGEVIETLNRKELWNVQTPQVFRYADLLKAHEIFAGQDFTDDAALMEKAEHKVFVVQGSYKNLKITTEEDFKIAQSLL
ncbi:MAG: 2-C-methyl-D-erythritol 4-phosphate cytidylyltransferase [Candidatus Melainabacteria bacterium GWF2_37_15]|nr:MAG: 2-C-methyl-D-erythritol 4-phosphate cytidylyltransferase [Candidatus Melainabacteria bacterium GWF2_37_15]